MKLYIRNIPKDIYTGFKIAFAQKAVDLFTLLAFTLFVPIAVLIFSANLTGSVFQLSALTEPPLFIMTILFLSCLIGKALQYQYYSIGRKDLIPKTMSIPNHACALSAIALMFYISPESPLNTHIEYVIGAIVFWYAYRFLVVISHPQTR